MIQLLGHLVWSDRYRNRATVFVGSIQVVESVGRLSVLGVLFAGGRAGSAGSWLTSLVGVLAMFVLCGRRVVCSRRGVVVFSAVTR